MGAHMAGRAPGPDGIPLHLTFPGNTSPVDSSLSAVSTLVPGPSITSPASSPLAASTSTSTAEGPVSVGTIVAIVAGAVVVLGICACFLLLWLARRRENRRLGGTDYDDFVRQWGQPPGPRKLRKRRTDSRDIAGDMALRDDGARNSLPHVLPPLSLKRDSALDLFGPRSQSSLTVDGRTRSQSRSGGANNSGNGKALRSGSWIDEDALHGPVVAPRSGSGDDKRGRSGGSKRRGGVATKKSAGDRAASWSFLKTFSLRSPTLPDVEKDDIYPTLTHAEAVSELALLAPRPVLLSSPPHATRPRLSVRMPATLQHAAPPPPTSTSPSRAPPIASAAEAFEAAARLAGEARVPSLPMPPPQMAATTMGAGGATMASPSTSPTRRAQQQQQQQQQQYTTLPRRLSRTESELSEILRCTAQRLEGAAKTGNPPSRQLMGGARERAPSGAGVLTSAASAETLVNSLSSSASSFGQRRTPSPSKQQERQEALAAAAAAASVTTPVASRRQQQQQQQHARQASQTSVASEADSLFGDVDASGGADDPPAGLTSPSRRGRDNELSLPPTPTHTPVRQEQQGLGGDNRSSTDSMSSGLSTVYSEDEHDARGGGGAADEAETSAVTSLSSLRDAAPDPAAGRFSDPFVSFARDAGDHVYAPSPLPWSTPGAMMHAPGGSRPLGARPMVAASATNDAVSTRSTPTRSGNVAGKPLADPFGNGTPGRGLLQLGNIPQLKPMTERGYDGANEETPRAVNRYDFDSDSEHDDTIQRHSTDRAPRGSSQTPTKAKTPTDSLYTHPAIYVVTGTSSPCTTDADPGSPSTTILDTPSSTRVNLSATPSRHRYRLANDNNNGNSNQQHGDNDHPPPVPPLPRLLPRPPLPTLIARGNMNLAARKVSGGILKNAGQNSPVLLNEGGGASPDLTSEAGSTFSSVYDFYFTPALQSQGQSRGQIGGGLFLQQPTAAAANLVAPSAPAAATGERKVKLQLQTSTQPGHMSSSLGAQATSVLHKFGVPNNPSNRSNSNAAGAIRIPGLTLAANAVPQKPPTPPLVLPPPPHSPILILPPAGPPSPTSDYTHDPVVAVSPNLPIMADLAPPTRPLPQPTSKNGGNNNTLLASAAQLRRMNSAISTVSSSAASSVATGSHRASATSTATTSTESSSTTAGTAGTSSSGNKKYLSLGTAAATGSNAPPPPRIASGAGLGSGRMAIASRRRRRRGDGAGSPVREEESPSHGGGAGAGRGETTLQGRGQRDDDGAEADKENAGASGSRPDARGSVESNGSSLMASGAGNDGGRRWRHGRHHSNQQAFLHNQAVHTAAVRPAAGPLNGSGFPPPPVTVMELCMPTIDVDGRPAGVKRSGGAVGGGVGGAGGRRVSGMWAATGAVPGDRTSVLSCDSLGLYDEDGFLKTSPDHRFRAGLRV